MIKIVKKFIEKASDILIIELDIDDKIKSNDSIKLEIENINKIKDAEVIEISSLDNDSTIKLFYKLVKE